MQRAVSHITEQYYDIFIILFSGLFYIVHTNIILIAFYSIDVLPAFTWDLKSDTVNLIIDFHDEGERDVVNLQRINSEFGDDEKDEEDGDCILMGYLRDETNVPVTVDGCPGNDVFQVDSNINTYTIFLFPLSKINILLEVTKTKFLHF